MKGAVKGDHCLFKGDDYYYIQNLYFNKTL